MPGWESFVDLGTRLMEGTARTSGASELSNALQGGYSTKDAFHDWTMGAEQLTGLPSTLQNTREILFDPNWRNEQGGHNVIDQSWALTNAKDEQPLFKYTIAEPMKSFTNVIADLFSTDAQHVTGLAGGVAGGVGGPWWGAAVGGGGADVNDLSTNEALGTTAGGILSGVGSTQGFSWGDLLSGVIQALGMYGQETPDPTKNPHYITLHPPVTAGESEQKSALAQRDAEQAVMKSAIAGRGNLSEATGQFGWFDSTQEGQAGRDTTTAILEQALKLGKQMREGKGDSSIISQNSQRLSEANKGQRKGTKSPTLSDRKESPSLSRALTDSWNRNFMSALSSPYEQGL